MGDDVTVSGPLFDGTAELAVKEFVRAATKAIATEGERTVRVNLAGSLQHPTGHYEGSIHTDISGDEANVSDGGIVYGPWLEGTGSRNVTTRFKGYSSFRRARQATDARAMTIAETELRRYIGRMG